MRLRLGLQLPSVAATMGAGDPFVPSNADFIDWESRGAKFVAVNGRTKKEVRQDYHALFETGLLDPFKNGSCLFFAGVTFATCFIPAVARNFDEPVDNVGFVVGDHFPDGLQGRGLPYIDTELGFLSGQQDNHSMGVWGSTLTTITASGDVGNSALASGACFIQERVGLNDVSIRSGGLDTTGAFTASLTRAVGIRWYNRQDSSQFVYYHNTGQSTHSVATADVLANAIKFFARPLLTPTDRKLQCGFFGDAHPAPTDLRTALNDLFITKMGITI
jgi:hypothetical protein